MRIILATIILTMLAQPVWASEVATEEKFYGIEAGKFRPLHDRQLCETAITEGVILGTSSKTDHNEGSEYWSFRTDTRIFFKGNIYSILVIDRNNATSGEDRQNDIFACLKFYPKK